MIENKNILVTGGAGFIGSHLVEKLLSHGNFVFILDNFNDYYDGKEKNVEEVTQNYKSSKEYKVISGDIKNETVYQQINKKIEIIFHLAAQAGVRYSLKHASEVTTNNITGTVNIFEYGRKQNIQKIAFASSSSVYGNPQYTPLDEKHPKNPISPYAVTKLCGEEFADYYFREYNLPITSLRFYTVYGPRGRPDMAIRKFFNLILDEKEITIYGDGEQKRDFTYVADIVDGLILAAEKKKASGKSFNLGYSNPITVNELVNKMYNITGKKKKVKYIEKQKGDVEITYSNTEKAKRILGYLPKVHIDKGLKKTYQWHIETERN